MLYSLCCDTVNVKGKFSSTGRKGENFLCYGLNGLSPKNLHVEILIPNVIALGDEGLGR
jgi:hypothetical protein